MAVHLRTHPPISTKESASSSCDIESSPYFYVVLILLSVRERTSKALFAVTKAPRYSKLGEPNHLAVAVISSGLPYEASDQRNVRSIQEPTTLLGMEFCVGRSVDDYRIAGCFSRKECG